MKNIKCKFCDSDKLELQINIEPKEILIICCRCGATETVATYKKDSTFLDIKIEKKSEI